MTDLAFLEEDDAPEAAETGSPPVEPTPELANDAPPEPAPQPIEAPQPEPQQPPQAAHVPITALLEERERRQRAEQEAQRLQQQFQPPELPDPYEDPQGFAQLQEQRWQAQRLSDRLNMSEEMVRTTHGDEVVNAAQQWAMQRFQQTPAFQAEVYAQRNPYGFVVKEYQRAQTLEKLGGADPAQVEAFLAWRAANQGGATPQPAAAPAASPTPRPTAPPPSLAAAPSAGGVAVQVEDEPFDAEFRKKG